MNVPVSMLKVPDLEPNVAEPEVIVSFAEGFPDSIKLPFCIASFANVPSKIFPFCHRIIPLPFFLSLALLELGVISPT